MWNRKELKENAKISIKTNLGICIIAALLLAFSTGAGVVSAPATVHVNTNQSIEQNIDTDSNTNDTELIEDQEDIDALMQDLENDFNQLTEQEKNDFIIGIGAISAVIIFTILIATIIAMLITAFLCVPIEVGARKFFVQNSQNTNASLSKDNIGFGFSGGYYKSIVKSVFGTKFFIWLWSLLLIIPGIYKKYCWRLVPYIIGENPQLTGKEARQISNNLMNGNKWQTFVLDLSFIGWYLLGGLTLGILNIVWVNPYKAQTDAKLYEALSKQ